MTHIIVVTAKWFYYFSIFIYYNTGEGFIYAVTVNGITGERTGFNDDLGAHLEKLKAVSPVPVLAGFGISTPEQVKSIGALSDGVIVGSTIVTALHNGALDTVRDLVKASKNEKQATSNS